MKDSHTIVWLLIALVIVVDLVLGFSSPHLIESRFGWDADEASLARLVWLVSSGIGIALGCLLIGTARWLQWLFIAGALCLLLLYFTRFTVTFLLVNLGLVAFVCCFSLPVLWREDRKKE